MFTGLVQRHAEVLAIQPEEPGVRLTVSGGELANEARVGDSVAVNGCCLTVVRVEGDGMSFQAGAETLARTNLGTLAAGDRVNLETSLRVGDPLGGHYVTGHVDGQAEVAAIRPDGDWSCYWFRTRAELTRQMAGKGSVTVDGVSLTLVDVEADRFSVALIPHTLSVTTLGARRVGDRVNLETDILAKYVARQVEGLGGLGPGAGGGG